MRIHIIQELGNAEAQAALAWAMLHPEMLAGTWEADVPAAREWAGTKCSTLFLCNVIGN